VLQGVQSSLQQSSGGRSGYPLVSETLLNKQLIVKVFWKVNFAACTVESPILIDSHWCSHGSRSSIYLHRYVSITKKRRADRTKGQGQWLVVSVARGKSTLPGPSSKQTFRFCTFSLLYWCDEFSFVYGNNQCRLLYKNMFCHTSKPVRNLTNLGCAKLMASLREWAREAARRQKAGQWASLPDLSYGPSSCGCDYSPHRTAADRTGPVRGRKWLNISLWRRIKRRKTR